MSISTPIARRERERFLLLLIKPSHYDDDGYVIQWMRTGMPSNSLACLYGIANEAIGRNVLGDNVDISIVCKDETNTRIKTDAIIREFRRHGGKGLVALVGVQSNQYPRAVDIARPLREANIPVCIGGFHAAGVLAMLPEPPPEVHDAWKLGISIFAGEAEGRMDELLSDAYHNRLKPLYDYTKDLPGLEGVPTPILPRETIARTIASRTSFDSGRGCPFQCSFCTIINVQGRKSRYSSADDIEKLIRENVAQGIHKFFITDDNFARNRNWEAIFDRLAQLRQSGMRLKFIIQVDTLCHRIPRFVEKAGAAGVNRVFIGLENINPDNLAAAKKKQNRITEYRSMLQQWKSIGALTYCGYIIGFPHDTPARLKRDIEIIKRELPVDLLELFCLTPLPGSEDHQVLHKNGVWMDPDLNIYDTEHVTTAHPLMSAEEWRAAYRDAWRSFYQPEHIETVMRRAVASGMRANMIFGMAFAFYSAFSIEGIHPLQGGIFRRKYRLDRRPELPVESRLSFYWKYGREVYSKLSQYLSLSLKYRAARKRVMADPNRANYTDLALTPVTDEETGTLEIFSATPSAKQAVEKAEKMGRQRDAAAAFRAASAG